MNRHGDIIRFYELLDALRDRVSGPRYLSDLGKRDDWPERGVYFFFEPTECRSCSGSGPRVVRVGTHGLVKGGGSTLKGRLRQHRGNLTGGGNHRGSVFRLLIGQALLSRGDLPQSKSWGHTSNATKLSAELGIGRRAMLDMESPIENAVSNHIQSMPFLWVDINDAPGLNSLRGYIERNAIALLSNLDRPSVDPATVGWLGQCSDRPLVRDSGLWNQRYVNDTHDPDFLNQLERLIGATQHR